MSQVLEDISHKLQQGKAEDVKQLVQEAINAGIEPGVILQTGLIAGMDVIGKKFRADEIFVPEVLIAARAMHVGMNLLKPLLADSSTMSAGTVVLGTVKGDMHDIGKNLVGMMLEGAGFKVVDIGVDVLAEKFGQAVQDNGADIVAISALLTTTMPKMKTVIEKIKEMGLRDKVKIIIGGAPVTQRYADEIGADGFAGDAASAVELAKSLVSGQE